MSDRDRAPGGRDLAPEDVAPHRGRATAGFVVFALVVVAVLAIVFLWADDAPDLSSDEPAPIVTDDDAPAGDLGN
ncbi:hypothetical protein MWU52_15770 [Jannaschia sp. S6380]|uniref:hypothetical protein n=1 Tax=Jannaschia sp. S6380 TaxID=2926408 RepID=UPI001FF41054|nr:hypothetical protein [Jannaschia sp. S6380]MCK0169013.1 hypothetical protein [Jannaschia sp. S6380]